MQVPRSCNHCRNSSGATVMGKSLTPLGIVGGLLNTYVTFLERRLLVVRQTYSVGKDDRKTIGGPAHWASRVEKRAVSENPRKSLAVRAIGRASRGSMRISTTVLGPTPL